MGQSKEKWFEEENNNPNNWTTNKCNHCGEYYPFNRVTKREKSPENQWCDDCYDKLKK